MSELSDDLEADDAAGYLSVQDNCAFGLLFDGPDDVVLGFSLDECIF